MYSREEALFRRLIAEIYEANNDLYSANEQLKEIYYDEDCFEEKIDDYLRVARNFFDDGDSASAETFVRKVMHIIHNTSDKNKEYNYRFLYARTQDSNRDFINAAHCYI